MRTVKAKIIIDQVWLEAFLRPRYAVIEVEAITIGEADKEQIINILEQIYRQDLEQQ